jgi:hypothetical protein
MSGQPCPPTVPANHAGRLGGKDLFQLGELDPPDLEGAPAVHDREQPFPGDILNRQAFKSPLRHEEAGGASDR